MEKEFETKCNDLKTLDSGAKRDNNAGKGAYELISPFALERLAKIYERGANQKGARNWEKGINFGRCIQSAKRHINQYMQSMDDEDHLAQACWNLCAVMHYEEMIERKIIGKEYNDLPNYKSKEKTKKDIKLEEINDMFCL
jgi:hypothetical protein